MTKKEVIILLSIGLLILLLYVSAGFFSHPSLDDFIYAQKGRQKDFIGTVLHERETWNGRYISNFIVYFSPLNWGSFIGYKLMPFGLILFTFFGTQQTFKNILDKHSFLLATVTNLIMYSILPDITEGVFWYTGAYTYIPSGVIFLYVISFVFRYWSRINYPHLVFIIVLIFLVCGFNEIIPLLGVVLFTFMLFTINEKRAISILILCVFISLFYYVISAPGNSIRASYFPEKNQLFISLYKSTLYSIRFIGEWVLNPAFIFWTVILLKLKYDAKLITKLSLLQRPIVIIFLLTFPTYIACFGPIWSTGLLGQYRTANLACYFFVPTFTLLVVANKDYLIKKLSFFIRFKHSYICLLILITFWGNQFTLIKEFVYGNMFRFNQEMYRRYEMIENCKQNVCEIPEIKNKSNILFVYPLVENPKDFHNLSYQLYFNSGEINLKKP